MKPVSLASDDDDLRQSPDQPASSARGNDQLSSADTGETHPTEANVTEANPAEANPAEVNPAEANPAEVNPAEVNPTEVNEPPSITPAASLSGQLAGPLELLQRRYTDQLSQDIEHLEAEKARLQSDITALQSEYEQCQADLRSQQSAKEESQPSSEEESQRLSLEELLRESAAKQPTSTSASSTWSPIGPRLPGEPAEASVGSVPVAPAMANRERTSELPIPATSKHRRQRRSSSQRIPVHLRKGLILSAIATVLMAWHYSLIGTLGQGGSWLGLSIGELGAGFIPIVALLWLRMLVTVPALILLAPQLHKDTWKELQNWIYTLDRRFLLLISSGVALFFSQVLIYQCVGIEGPVLGTTLLFLYPLTAVPLGSLLNQERQLTPLGLLAMVAIAMGGILAVRPLLGSTLGAATPSTPWLGIGASVAFSLYIVLTNLSHRQQCHPIPVGVVQFSTVAVLSSLILLVKPLRLANISWVGFMVWGLLMGLAMLLVYLFTYSSLRMIGSRVAIVTATTPLVTMLIAVGFAPGVSLEIIQWTGVLLVTTGGLVLSKDKLNSGHKGDIF